MNKKQIWIGIIVLIVVALAVWFNSYDPVVSSVPSGDSDQVEQSIPRSPTVRPVVDPNEILDVGMGIEQVTPNESVKSFVVTGSNFSFAPSTMTVHKGDVVQITFVNSGGAHDLRIDEFGVATKRIGSGERETVRFVADKVGSFEYYCSVGSHRAMGMKGTLTVQ